MRQISYQSLGWEFEGTFLDLNFVDGSTATYEIVFFGDDRDGKVTYEIRSARDAENRDVAMSREAVLSRSSYNFQSETALNAFADALARLSLEVYIIQLNTIVDYECVVTGGGTSCYVPRSTHDDPQ